MTDIDPSAPQPGSQPIIPLYNDRLANSSFDPFGPKEGADIDSRANRGYGQETSRFQFAQGPTVMTPPPRPSVAYPADVIADGCLIKTAVDALFVKVEQGHGRRDWPDLTGDTPPQQPQSPRAASGFEGLLPRTTLAPLADTEEGMDVKLDAVVVVPR